MKKMIISSLIMLFVFAVSNNSISQTNTQPITIKKSLRKQFPQFTVGAYGGGVFPLPKLMSENFKPGWNLDLDLVYRVNREVGIFGNAGYYFMSSKTTGAPIGSYLIFTAGPRYYFTKPNLNSSLFVEGGVGAFNFRQKSYVAPGDTTGAVIAQINNVRPGLVGGVGATLPLSQVMDIVFESKYNVVFTPNGSTNFMTVGAGFVFRFR